MLLSIEKVHALVFNLWDPRSTLLFVANCAAIQVDENDCIINNFISLVSQAKTQENDSSSAILQNCGPPQINYSQLSDYFDRSQKACMVHGSDLTIEQAQDSLLTISQILMSSDCWNAYCQERERYRVVETLKTGIINGVAPCSNVTIDSGSCLLSTSLTILSSRIQESLQGSVLNQLFLQVDNSMAHMPNITMQAIIDSTMQGGSECQSMGMHYDTVEIERTKTTLGALFSYPTCWSLGDGKHNMIGNDLSSDTLAKVYLEQVMGCVGIEKDGNSCVEKMLLQHWNSFVAILSPQSHLDFGDECRSPVMTAEEMELVLERSTNVCQSNGFQPTTTEIQNALQKLKLLIQSPSCWLLKCDEQLESRLKYSWMQQCTNVRLPAYLVQPSSILRESETDEMDSVLGCMIDFVISSQPSSFGLFDSAVSGPGDMCVPVMFTQRMTRQFCSVELGPKALSSCYNVPKPWDFSMSYQYHHQHSLSYSYISSDSRRRQNTRKYGDMYPFFDETLITRKPKSMHNIDYSLSYSYRTKPDIDVQALVDDLCVIVELWSSDDGKKCFQDICDGYGGNIEDNWLNSDRPYSSLTEPPSAKPSIVPSYNPRTSSPFKLMSFETNEPTLLATKSSSRPSLKKTSVPSTEAGISPSRSPTRQNSEDGSSSSVKVSPTASPSHAPQTKEPYLNVPYRTTAPMYAASSSSPRPVHKTTLAPLKNELISPSSKPIMNPVQNGILTRVPTKNKAPISQPTTFVSPTYSPSTTRRTLSPAVPQGKGVVAVIVQAQISLRNMNETQVPAPGPERNSMVRVIEIAIDKTLPMGAKSRVLRLGTISISRRLLRELSAGLPIDFEVTVSQICGDAACTKSSSVADDLYSNVTNSLKESLTTGEISQEIMAVAESQNVTVLKEVTLDTQSFVTLSKQVTVIESSTPSSIVTSSSECIKERFALLIGTSLGLLVSLVIINETL
jgi:hypothetical protein